MSKTIVALDCMGGDNAPFEIVKGAVEATNENKDILVKLVGVEEQIKEELSKYKYNSDQLEIVNATEIIETGEPPVAAIREKTDSSLVKCLYMVKKGEANIIKKVGGKEDTKKFLGNIGFVVGAAVTVISEIKGNMIVEVKNSRVAIGKDMANKIIV